MAYESSSPAKDVVRDYIMGSAYEIVDQQTKLGIFSNKKDLPVLFLPGSAGLEIPSYRKMGISPGSLLGVEQDRKKFTKMKDNGWGINLFNGSIEQLALGIQELVGTGHISQRFHLVDGKIKRMLLERNPRFFMYNLDVYSDIGNLMESFTPSLFTYLCATSVVCVTTYARQDPLSVESAFGVLHALIQVEPTAKTILEKSLRNLLTYTSGDFERANRLLLREVCFLYNLFSAANRTPRYEPFFLFNPEGKQQFIEYMKKAEGDLLEKYGKENTPKKALAALIELAQLQKFAKKLHLAGASEIRDVLSLFKNYSVLDLLHIKDPDKEELYGLNYVLRYPSCVYPHGFARMIYKNEVGSPMLTWIIEFLYTGLIATENEREFQCDTRFGFRKPPSNAKCILSALDWANHAFFFINKRGKTYNFLSKNMEETTVLKRHSLSKIKIKKPTPRINLEYLRKKRKGKNKQAKKSRQENRRRKKK